jgi:hypothetical protein
MFTRPLDSFAPNQYHPSPMMCVSCSPSPRCGVSLLISVLRAALIKSDVQEINRSALNKKDTELPFFWAYVDSADTTSTIVKVPMHCYYGDRGGLSQPRMSQVDGPMRANAPGVLKSMDRTGVVGFECVTCP